MYISLKERSSGRYLVFFLGNPNNEFSQTLLKPINPTTLQININTIQLVGAILNSSLKRINSQLNFIVPGRPEKNTNIKIIEIPKFGVTCIIPLISTIDLVW